MAPYFSITSPTLFASSINSYVNLKDSEMYFTMITQTIEIMKNFLVLRILSFIDQMQSIFYALLVYQLIVMVVLFYFGYVRFYLFVEF